MMDISAEKASMDDAKRSATTPIVVMANHRPSQLSHTLHLCPQVNTQLFLAYT